MKKWILSLAFLMILSGCMENGIDIPDLGAFPIGVWEIQSYQETGKTLKSKSSLPQNTFGYIFQPNGRMVNRSINGFCGTPPVMTEDFPGTWTRIGDTIRINMRFWGGSIQEDWKILQSTNSTVTLEILRSTYTYDFD